MLFMPIVVPFYLENDLGMKDVLMLQGVYSITIVLLEIPSGYFADVLGRRKTLILGSFFGFFGFLTYSLTGGFWGFLLAEVVLGFGQSMISGADSAMLYDSLAENKEEKQYMKYEGRITSIGNIAEAVAGTLGGLLAGISLRTPYIAQTFIALIAIPSAFLLVEPARHKVLTVMKFKDILNIVRYALFQNRKLQRNIFFSSLIGTATLTMAWFVQPVFLQLEIQIELFGVLWTALNLIVGLTAIFAHRIENKIGETSSIVLIALLVPAGYLSLGFISGYISLAILVVFYMVRGFATPVLKDYINKVSEANIRATILSVRNFIIRFNFVLIAPFLGWYTDFYSLKQAFLLAGIIFLSLSLFTMILFLESLKKGFKSQKTDHHKQP
jgi:MFS family permease